jgi:hypothetical protein
MSREDKINQIKWLDNVGYTDEMNLWSMSLSDLELLENELFVWSHQRQKDWVDHYRKNQK